MNLEVSKEDLTVLKTILEKEIASVRVEIHHCRTHDYKDFLKKTETQLEGMQARVKALLGS